MEIINRVSRMAAITAKTLVTDVKIGLVATSGAINPGQLGLIQTARRMADLVVVSILANRLEFSSEEEYRQYPHDITADIDLLRPENVDYVFIPPEEEFYPPNFSSFAEVRLGGELAGLPSFLFRGLATGILKILHLTKPAYTFYGEPQALQGAILRKMVRDFNISTEVVTAPVPRSDSGLAHSGRNRLLTESQLQSATVFYRSLRAAENAIASGEAHSKKILAEIARVTATEESAKLEYAVIADPEKLEPLSKVEGPAMIAIGGRIGNVFLSDAIVVGRPSTVAGR